MRDPMKPPKPGHKLIFRPGFIHPHTGKWISAAAHGLTAFCFEVVDVPPANLNAPPANDDGVRRDEIPPPAPSSGTMKKARKLDIPKSVPVNDATTPKKRAARKRKRDDDAS